MCTRQNKTKKTILKLTEHVKITIQATEGHYEATQTKDNETTCPIQKQLNLTMYHISGPPRYIRNVPKYIPAKATTDGGSTKN